MDLSTLVTFSFSVWDIVYSVEVISTSLLVVDFKSKASYFVTHFYLKPSLENADSRCVMRRPLTHLYITQVLPRESRSNCLFNTLAFFQLNVCVEVPVMAARATTGLVVFPPSLGLVKYSYKLKIFVRLTVPTTYSSLKFINRHNTLSVFANHPLSMTLDVALQHILSGNNCSVYCHVAYIPCDTWLPTLAR